MVNQQKAEAKKKILSPRNIAFLVCGVVFALIILIIVIFQSTQSERSVASFCWVAKQQKSILTTDVSYDKRLEAYKKLEAVSPDDIRSDITTIRKGYESIVQNPSNTISAGIGMSGAENRRTDYITKNCTDF